MLRIGIGYDAHRLVPGRKLILGGVEIPHETGLDGHSDADVATHALIDALIGAAGLGSIGQMFPDSDPAYKNVNSLVLLEEACLRLASWRINNVDATIVCQNPKLLPYIHEMEAKWRAIMECERVNIKATTTEFLGFEGREEGISAMCVCILEQTQGTLRKRNIIPKNSNY